MNTTHSIVATYGSSEDAEAAVMELKRSGFAMENLSLLGRDYHTDDKVVGYYQTGDRMKSWGTQGAFWGGMWGVFVEAAFFWIPGLGPTLVAGPLVSLILGALEGALVVGGLSAIGAGLYGLGISESNILVYETAIKAGKYVLIIHISATGTRATQEIINRTKPESWERHP